jgi:hypothetical protein
MRRRAERLTLGALVLALHAVLLWSWRDRAPPRDRREAKAPAQAPLVVRLLGGAPDLRTPPPPPPAGAKQAPTRASHVNPPHAAAPQRSDPPRAEPQAITVVASPPQAPASAPVERNLDTTLPAAVARPAERSFKDRVLNDPRSNSSRATIESRVATVAGTGDLVEERMDATRTRLRQHGQCIEVHVSRDAQLNPWNQNHSPTPKAVKPSC